MRLFFFIFVLCCIFSSCTTLKQTAQKTILNPYSITSGTLSIAEVRQNLALIYSSDERSLKVFQEALDSWTGYVRAKNLTPQVDELRALLHSPEFFRQTFPDSIEIYPDFYRNLDEAYQRIATKTRLGIELDIFDLAIRGFTAKKAQTLWAKHGINIFQYRSGFMGVEYDIMNQALLAPVIVIGEVEHSFNEEQKDGQRMTTRIKIYDIIKGNVSSTSTVEVRTFSGRGISTSTDRFGELSWAMPATENAQFKSTRPSIIFLSHELYEFTVCFPHTLNNHPYAKESYQKATVPINTNFYQFDFDAISTLSKTYYQKIDTLKRVAKILKELE